MLVRDWTADTVFAWAYVNAWACVPVERARARASCAYLYIIHCDSPPPFYVSFHSFLSAKSGPISILSSVYFPLYSTCIFSFATVILNVSAPCLQIIITQHKLKYLIKIHLALIYAEFLWSIKVVSQIVEVSQLAWLSPTTGCFNDLYMYEPSTSHWTNLTDRVIGPLPTERAYFGFAPCGGKLYVFAGFSDIDGKNQGKLVTMAKVTLGHWFTKWN